jgi:hypothetical protein
VIPRPSGILALAALALAPPPATDDRGQTPVPTVAIERRMAQKLGLGTGDTIVL